VSCSPDSRHTTSLISFSHFGYGLRTRLLERRRQSSLLSCIAMVLTFHIIGDAYVDFFCFLDGDWPEQGGDSRLGEPVRSYAGGSSTNTATHLKSLVRHFVKGDDEPHVVLNTVLNPDDHYGQLLMQHAETHGFPLINCRSDDDKSSTGHCIAIVSGGERSFMTHQGCVENFSANNLQIDKIVDVDGPVHIHVAGFYNTTGFWNGNLKEQLIHIHEERKKKRPNQTTTISLVTQHDASKEWDGGLDDVIPYLDFLIMNDVEASRILRRGRGGKEPDPNADIVEEWISFFSPLNPEACIVVTRGADGAVAFRNGELITTFYPATVVEAIDPTGAGDSFTAGFLHGIWAWKREHGELDGASWSAEAVNRGLLLGCAVGSSTVSIRGASVPSQPEDIMKLYDQQMKDGA
jgi:sugar/nucleoside kinase (ribokinase family)